MMKKLHMLRMIFPLFLFLLIGLVGCRPQDQRGMPIPIPPASTSPPTAEWHFEEGNKLFDKGRLQNAISEYDEAIRLNPQYDKAYNNRANAYFGLGQMERAIKDYD